MIPEEAKLVLVEPVISPEIYNVSYRADDPRIYGGTRISTWFQHLLSTAVPKKAAR
jgi:hypothetical protein